MLHVPFALLLAAPSAVSPLYADHAEATSFLKSNWNKYEENYHPSYVLDGDPKTAWVEGRDGDGVGESITIPVSTVATARSVRVDVWNGYQKSKNLLDANGAPTGVTVVVRGPGGRVTGTAKATLKRAMGKQSISVPVTGGVEAVQLVVDSVITGKKYKDTCISDVQVFVDSDVPYNAKAEGAKRGALKTWIKERKDTAAYFAKLPREYPFASSRFEGGNATELARVKDFFEMVKVEPWGEVEVPKPAVKTVKARLGSPLFKDLGADDRALLTRLLSLDEAKEDAMPEAGTWMSPSVKGKVPLAPDNLEFLSGTWVILSDVAFFEAKGKKGSRRVLWGEGFSEDESTPPPRYEAGHETYSNAFVTRRGDGTIAAVYRHLERTIEDRATETTTARELLVYDEGQRLMARVEVSLSTQMHQPDFSLERLQLDRLTWKDGKVSAVDRVISDTDWSQEGTRLTLSKERFTAGALVAAAPAP
jgi:hypothetical protein